MCEISPCPIRRRSTWYGYIELLISLVIIYRFFMVKLRGRSMSYASSLARKRYRARGGGYLAPSATNARVPSSFQNVKRRNRKYNKVCISYRPTCPAQMIVPMKYVSEVLSRTCTVGASTYYLWNFNDIYDPDRTGTGH